MAGAKLEGGAEEARCLAVGRAEAVRTAHRRGGITSLYEGHAKIHFDLTQRDIFANHRTRP